MLERKLYHIDTAYGHSVNPTDLMVEDIDIRDIAHALGMLCRFNGHCNRFYSVAEHSVLVSRLCSPEFALEGLLHDAAEAYLGDVPTPLKRQWPEFRHAEDRAYGVIARKFLIPEKTSTEVVAADTAALQLEKPRLLVPFNSTGDISPLICLSPEDSKISFLSCFKELTCVKP